MIDTRLNPEFSTIVSELSLKSEYPFGKYKGETVADVLVEDYTYVRWFENNVPSYKLSAEAIKLLCILESESNYDCEALDFFDSEGAPW
jgi:uncharacterized protein (DUF3820 family)